MADKEIGVGCAKQAKDEGAGAKVQEWTGWRQGKMTLDSHFLHGCRGMDCSMGLMA